MKLDGFVKNHQGRHPGESRGPEILFHWIPAFAGMTEKAFFRPFRNEPGIVALILSFGVLHSTFDLPAMPASGFEIGPPYILLRLLLRRKLLRRAGGYSAVRF